MKNIQNAIDLAIKNEPDYSMRFFGKIEIISRGIQGLTGFEVILGQSMDYCPAQYIAVRLKNHINPSLKTGFEVRFYFSSKASLFFVYIIDEAGRIKNHHGNSHPLPFGVLSEAAQDVIVKISNFLVENSYQEVTYEFYDKRAVGCMTQMDGLPASIFEALFAEIV
ncbi:hypothetical protein [Paracidovorax avenae]|uniref:hypothetical protein n=1 Tax=Paracidovorax avenae TaxID=80867 RepID=UPI0012601F36|nr:hypothetical protein [Paracidovorax avenae]